MIPALLARNMRVIAPDFFGFGRSDKPDDEATYTFEFHRNSIMTLISALDLRRITLVCQGLGWADRPDHPNGHGRSLRASPGHEHLAWNRRIPAGRSLLGMARVLEPQPRHGHCRSDETRRSLVDRGERLPPMPRLIQMQRTKAVCDAFPILSPKNPTPAAPHYHAKRAISGKNTWAGQSFMAIGLQDPILGRPAMMALRKTIRNCPSPLELEHAGHFAQEAGAIIVEKAWESFNAH